MPKLSSALIERDLGEERDQRTYERRALDVQLVEQLFMAHLTCPTKVVPTRLDHPRRNKPRSGPRAYDRVVSTKTPAGVIDAIRFTHLLLSVVIGSPGLTAEQIRS